MQQGYIKPLCFWAWNGDMNTTDMRSQLKELSGQGMGGVFIHSRAGLKFTYMGEEWFNAYAEAIKECEKLNLEVWIYDEDGWPSGFAGGRVCAFSEDFHQRYLLSKTVNLPGDTLPENTVAVYRKDGEGFKIVSKGQCGAEYPQGEYTAVYAVFNHVYIDILNRDAVQYFIECTHEEYKKRFGGYFGSLIKGIFTDEPHFSPRGIPWGKYIPSEFEKKHGYSVYEALPYMFFKTGNYRNYRYDFWENISAMMLSSYVKPYYEWCCKNNLIFTGHFACEEGQVDQVGTNGGVMPLYEFQHMPGVDSLGNRLAPAPIFKQAEAVAWQLGDRKLLCETYACSGYDATFSDIMWIWAYQAALGVNVPCLSISMFSLTGTRKRDYPVFFSEQMPWWKRFSTLAKSFDFINNNMVNGERPEGILLIHPKTSVWCEKGRDYKIEECRISSDFRMLTESLIDLQKDFDYGDEHIMERHASVAGNKLIVGKRAYNTVIVPPLCNLLGSTVKLIKEFSGNGGKVIFTDNLPDMVDGRPADKSDFDFPKEIISSRTDLLRKYFVCSGFLQDIELIDKYTRRTALGFVTAIRLNGNKALMLAVNRSREEKRSVRVKANGKKGISKILLDLREIPIKFDYDIMNNVTYADIEFDCQEACFIKTSEFKQCPAGKPEEVKYLTDFEIETGDNVLAVDKVSYKIDCGEFSRENYTIFANQEFYDKIDGIGKNVTLSMKYVFNVKGNIAGKISLSCEDGCGRVFINGKDVKKQGYFVDKGFGRFNITDGIREGLNEVIIEKEIGKYKSRYGKDIFQSVTNVFSYEYYIENIYIIGCFDAVPDEDFSAGENCFWMDSKGAYITEFTGKKDITELTTQGMPYYYGTVKARTNINYAAEKGMRYIISFDKPDFACMDLLINGNYVANTGIPPYNIDITDYLKGGKNGIEFHIYSTARNMFGPFHHIKGRHNYVGHTVFKGYVEFEDPVVFPELTGKSTWTDNYSFAPFGLKNIKLEKMRFD